MTYRHISYSESVVMKELEKIAYKKGLIVADKPKTQEIAKKASANDMLDVINYSDEFEAALQLSAALREKGYNKQAEILETKAFLYKQAYNNAEQDIEGRKEREKLCYNTNVGGDVLSAAHDAVEQDEIKTNHNEGFVHDVNQTQNAIINSLQHQPKQAMANEESKRLIAMAVAALTKNAQDAKKDNTSELVSCKSIIENNLNTLITTTPDFNIVGYDQKNWDLNKDIKGTKQDSFVEIKKEATAIAQTLSDNFKKTAISLQNCQASIKNLNADTVNNLQIDLSYLNQIKSSNNKFLTTALNALKDKTKEFADKKQSEKTADYLYKFSTEFAALKDEFNKAISKTLTDAAGQENAANYIAKINDNAKAQVMATLIEPKKMLTAKLQQLSAIDIKTKTPTASGSAPDVGNELNINLTNQYKELLTDLQLDAFKPFDTFDKICAAIDLNKVNFGKLFDTQSGVDKNKLLDINGIKTSLALFNEVLSGFQSVQAEVKGKKYESKVNEIIADMTQGDNLFRRKNLIAQILETQQLPEKGTSEVFKKVLEQFVSDLNAGISSLNNLKAILETEKAQQIKEDSEKAFQPFMPQQKKTSGKITNITKKAQHHPFVNDWNNVGNGQSSNKQTTTPNTNSGGASQKQPSSANSKRGEAVKTSIRDMQHLILMVGDYITSQKTNNDDKAKLLTNQFTQLYTSAKGFAGANEDGIWGKQTQRALEQINTFIFSVCHSEAKVSTMAPTAQETDDDIIKRALSNLKIIATALSSVDSSVAGKLGRSFGNSLVVDRLPQTVVPGDYEEKNSNKILLTTEHLRSLLILRAFLKRSGFDVMRNGNAAAKTSTKTTLVHSDEESKTKNSPQYEYQAPMNDIVAPWETADKDKTAAFNIINYINKIAKPASHGDTVSRGNINEHLSRTPYKTSEWDSDTSNKRDIENAQGLFQQKQITPIQQDNGSNRNALLSNDTWTYGQWYDILEYLKTRAEVQMQLADEKYSSYADDESSTEAQQAKGKFDLKQRYHIATANLLDGLQQLGITDRNAPITLEQLRNTSGNVGGDSGGGSYNNRGGFGRDNNRTNPRDNGREKDGSQFIRDPFVGYGRDDNKLYVRPLINAFGVKGDFSELLKGPTALDKWVVQGGNYSSLLGELGARTGIDIQKYIVQLRNMLESVWHSFEQRHSKEENLGLVTKQEEVYTAIMAGLRKLLENVPADMQNEGRQQKQQSGQVNPQDLRLATDAQRWQQLTSQAGFDQMMKERGFPFNSSNNCWVKQLKDNKELWINQSGAVYLFDKKVPYKAGQNPKFVRNFFDTPISTEE